MTEFPQLGEALDAAARRHYGPSHLRHVRRVLPPLVAAAAVAALALVLARPDAARPPDERAVEPATVAGTFGEHFEVFRRPRRPGDELPGKRSPYAGMPGMEGLDPEQSRLAATLGDVQVYLAPIPGETPSLCMFGYVEGRPSASSCTTLESASRESTPMASLGRSRRDGRPGLTDALFPDGTRDVRLVLDDGTVLAPEVRGNVLLAEHDEQVTSMSWTGRSGDRHALGAPDPDAGENFEDRGCPDAEPIPDEAAAERVAREAVPRLLPDDDGAVLEARSADRDPRLETFATACGARVTARIRVYDFRTGSITVARVGGRLQVFSVLDR